MTAPDGGPFLAPRRDDPSAVIRYYEEIAVASRRMLEAARRGDWADVERTEAHCRELIANLKRARADVRLDAADQARRVALLRAILHNDAQIRERAEPWLRDLEGILAPPQGVAD
jgi:flagellar protein FliT